MKAGIAISAGGFFVHKRGILFEISLHLMKKQYHCTACTLLPGGELGNRSIIRPVDAAKFIS